jgi:hypothetical protein
MNIAILTGGEEANRPAPCLHIMPGAAGIAFAIWFVIWRITCNSIITAGTQAGRSRAVAG